MKTGKRLNAKRRWSALALAFGAAAVCFGGKSADPKGGAINAEKTDAAVERDPFWPVGYEPEKPVDAEAVKQESLADKNWNEAMKQIAIQGVSRVSGECYAIINTEAKRVGETVSVEYGGLHYTWIVDRIEPPGSVKLRRVSAE